MHIILVILQSEFCPIWSPLMLNMTEDKGYEKIFRNFGDLKERLLRICRLFKNDFKKTFELLYFISRFIKNSNEMTIYILLLSGNCQPGPSCSKDG